MGKHPFKYLDILVLIEFIKEEVSKNKTSMGGNIDEQLGVPLFLYLIPQAEKVIVQLEEG